MNRRLRIPAREPTLPGEPLPLYLSVATELRLQVVGEDALRAPGRGQLPGKSGAGPLTAALAAAARAELLAKCLGREGRWAENSEASRYDHATH
jgi:hypothetical protein